MQQNRTCISLRILLHIHTIWHQSKFSNMSNVIEWIVTCTLNATRCNKTYMYHQYSDKLSMHYKQPFQDFSTKCFVTFSNNLLANQANNYLYTTSSSICFDCDHYIVYTDENDQTWRCFHIQEQRHHMFKHE